MTDRVVCMSTLAVAPGARLAQAVRRPDGGLLLAADTVIDDDQLRQLVQRGIDCIFVLQEETRDAEQIEREVTAAAARVAHLFRGAGGDSRDDLAAAVADYRRRAAS